MLKRNSMMIFGASMLAISSAYAGGDPNATNEDTVQNQNAGATTEQSSTSAASSASASGSTSQTSASASDSSRSGAQSGSGGQAVAQNSGYEGFDAVEDDELVIDTESLADGDGMGSIQVQWQISADGANWGVLPGAIQPSFTPRDSEVGKFLRVQVSYLDGQGNTEILTSPPSKAVQNVNDAPIGIPILTGQAIEDGALIVDVSRISDEDGLGAFNLIWQRSSKRTNWNVQLTSTGGNCLAIGLTSSNGT